MDGFYACSMRYPLRIPSSGRLKPGQSRKEPGACQRKEFAESSASLMPRGLVAGMTQWGPAPMERPMRRTNVGNPTTQG